MKKKLLANVFIMLFFLSTNFCLSQETKVEKLLLIANTQYINGEYAKAASNFNKLYNIDNANESYLYNASVSSINAKYYNLALQYLEVSS